MLTDFQVHSHLEINIKNQAFDKSQGNLFYNVRAKYHNATDNGWAVVYNIATYLPVQSTSSDYTDVGFSAVGQLPNFISLPGAQIDIQVKAMLGGEGRVSTSFNGYGFVGEESDWSNTQTISIPANTPLSSNPSSTSPTPTPSVSPSHNPTATSAQPQAGFLFGLDWEKTVIVVLVVVVACLAVGMVVLWRRVAAKR